VFASLRAGASGYVTDRASPEMLLAAVETVAAGGFALSAEPAGILRSEIAGCGPGAESHKTIGARLSAREDEALRLIACGFTHSQVARRMGVKKTTVDTYIERVRAKLRVGNKAELTRAAFERGRLNWAANAAVADKA
jgi:two-component system, NarL family, nitrate/nitrite response regulator NarL